MASEFKTARQPLKITSVAPVYTCPAGRTAIILNAHLAVVKLVSVFNPTLFPFNAGNESVTVWWTDASAGNAVTRLAFGLVVPIEGAVKPFDDKIVLEAGDTLRATVGRDDLVEMSVSILELF
jgi:hypothetical protein